MAQRWHPQTLFCCTALQPWGPRSTRAWRQSNNTTATLFPSTNTQARPCCTRDPHATPQPLHRPAVSTAHRACTALHVSSHLQHYLAPGVSCLNLLVCCCHLGKRKHLQAASQHTRAIVSHHLCVVLKLTAVLTAARQDHAPAAQHTHSNAPTDTQTHTHLCHLQLHFVSSNQLKYLGQLRAIGFDQCQAGTRAP